MTATIFDHVALGPEAESIRQQMTPSALAHLANALDHLAQISQRPVAELADRLICGYFDVVAGVGGARLQRLITDILTESDTQTIN